MLRGRTLLRPHTLGRGPPQTAHCAADGQPARHAARAPPGPARGPPYSAPRRTMLGRRGTRPSLLDAPRGRHTAGAAVFGRRGPRPSHPTPHAHSFPEGCITQTPPPPLLQLHRYSFWARLHLQLRLRLHLQLQLWWQLQLWFQFVLHWLTMVHRPAARSRRAPPPHFAPAAHLRRHRSPGAHTCSGLRKSPQALCA